MNALAEHLARVQERMAAAARRSGRDPSEVTLVAVTKSHPPDTILEAFELGVRHFGENRAEEASLKIPSVQSAISDQSSVISHRLSVISHQSSVITWHMIGHVQSRKAETVAGLFDWVHSVDGLKLAERLGRFAGQSGKTLNVLLEFNLSEEASKYGFRLKGQHLGDDPGLEKVVESIVALPSLNVTGLMTMAPIVAEPEQARPVFRALRRRRDELAARFPQRDWRHLSMGMTDDFEVAIEEGATMVRIGRAIFGERT
jgi:pyridoxal phosphate enzyme (YggS family)